jgi:two-component system, OmpR family, sensor kinase
VSRVLLAAWLTLALAPVAWWLRNRRRVDVWRAMPVPAALVAADRTVRVRSGPAATIDFQLTSGLPAAGRVTRAITREGVPVALSGLRGGGALVVALPADPVRDRRDSILAELGARLAHDINTPLTALHGHLDLLAAECPSRTSAASIRTCQRELMRLQSTAQDLLTYTRLRAGGGRRAHHLAGALLEEAAAALLDDADRSNATITVEVPHDVVLVDVADGDLVRALRNLLHNSLTHGLGTARCIRAAVDADDETVTFVVADSGPGMSDTELDHLVQPMVRGTAPTAPGSGLGLAIVAEVLAAHGSRLETRRMPDGLAALTFRLPRLRT